ncbi:hypothetical protein JDV02_009130 [Purpureocillium takamizusanense]|uniref:Uncharacterized protein n=1 Tax=Purpureocillium takamizusanense TaxID=2060973 RepID=A0A9Q8VDY3_9HYPO|nr:uncharacterized protein JDV02_009130 [Purpureocillium takamizusanense]UNI23300.1 hypothetical protein JDV02_009130 [Purpureocillium takamizusanense]
MSAPSSEPSFPPPPLHYPPCLHQRDCDKQLHRELREVYQSHSTTWDDESKSAWFSSIIDKATVSGSTNKKVSSHCLARSATAETVTWAHFCALSTIFKGRVHSSKKFIKAVLGKYPSADLNGLDFKESYKLPNAESTLASASDAAATAAVDSQDDTAEQLLQSSSASVTTPVQPAVATMPVQTRSASAKPANKSAPAPRATTKNTTTTTTTTPKETATSAPPESPPAAQRIKREPSEEEERPAMPAANTTTTTTTAAPATEPKKRKRLPEAAPNRTAGAAPKRQKRSTKAMPSTTAATAAAPTVETAEADDNTTTTSGPKRRGRKPGSVNKPRADIAALVARVEALEAEVQQLRTKDEKNEAWKRNVRAYRRKQSAQISRVRRWVAAAQRHGVPVPAEVWDALVQEREAGKKAFKAEE